MKELNVMNPSRKLVILIAAATLVIVVFAILVFSNTVQSVGTSASKDDFEENSISDIDESDKTAIEGQYNKSTIQKPEDSEEEITGLTEEKPYDKKLVEYDSKNILIVGEDKENYLYDTIIPFL